VLLKYPESVFQWAVTGSLMPTRTDSASLPKRMMKRSKLRRASTGGGELLVFSGTEGAFLRVLNHHQSC
jgi:hypothetical protein